ncbi:MAG TPA: aminotransferase class III-fold pyridoxal phosphate-dependent enzyme [Jatrophihabitantaceae bacterium]
MSDAIDIDVLASPAPVVATERLRDLLGRAWAVDPAALTPLPSERDLNVLVDDRFVLKVSNPAEAASIIDMEVAAAAHLQRADPGLAVPRTVATRGGEFVAALADDAGRPCRTRLITVLPGAPLEGTPISVDLAEQVGDLAARTSLALQGLFHPAGGRRIDWDVRRAADVLTNAEMHGAAQDIALVPRLAAAAEATRRLPSGLQHADVTLTNVLAEHGTVTGLIDFGDMHHTAAVCDLAVTLTAVLRNTAAEQPAGLWELTEAVLAGYQRRRLLLPDEVDVLGELVLARLAVTLANAARLAALTPGNTEYVGQHVGPNRRILDALLALDARDLADRLARIAGTLRAPRAATATDPGLHARRADVMGGELSPLFYRQPLEIVRGSGPWLYAADGTRYLDAYNNVAVLGHAHPAVTQAVTRQWAALNTHSRYLHPGIVELAERLLATMPAELDTCLFTTSGTEANDLAWRMATAYTGGSGAIIAEHAYHGSSKWLADLSSNEWPAGYRPSHVGTFAAPRATPTAPGHSDAATRIATAAEQLRVAGDRPALVLADLCFMSEGVLDASPDFITGLVAGAHQAGALFLSDEVQAGYGRIGPAMWRFALAGVTPDLVTLGKPMGAGYPIGAVITRREIADSLARSYEYFSTFAATPVAAAAALAVLDTLQHTAVLREAAATGKHLRSGLRSLAASSARLDEVRGTGLLAGVDVVAPDGTPPREFARDVLNGLTARRVLAGLTGPDGTVLKVRPPLVWRHEHADLFVATLAEVLAG